MNKAIIAAVLSLLALSAVSCGSVSSSSPPESTNTPAATAKSDAEEELSSAAQRTVDKMKETASEQGQKLGKGSSIPLEAEADTVLHECINSMYTADYSETIKYFYPEPIYNTYVNESETEDYEPHSLPDVEVTDIRITSNSRLAPDTGCACAENYFNITAEKRDISGFSVKVIKGYSVTFTADLITNGQKDTESKEVVVAELENTGWKVIPLSTEQLMQIFEN